MMNRRNLLVGLVISASFLLNKGSFGATQLLNSNPQKLEWQDFVQSMKDLSNDFALRKISQKDMELKGFRLISRLDIEAASFEQAVANSYESGNLFWLWQRLIKSMNLDGGILNIDQDQMIPLHDHPRATGMVRVISGETEVWQFERIDDDVHKRGNAELKLVARNILRPGDMAKVTPKNGNIHALRSVSKECAMLDFFIPPFEKSELLYFKPTTNDWFNQQYISGQAIPRTEFLWS